MSSNPGAQNLITDVGNFKIGHAQDSKIKTGTTVILPEFPVTASVAIHGGAPGSSDVALLEPHQTIEKINALVLSGGSAFGLDSCAGVRQWLLEQNTGFRVGDALVPVVPGAIVFDLMNNGDKKWGAETPYRKLAYRACENAKTNFEIGTHGAGYGATTANLKGGLGSASTELANGVIIGAIVVVNSIGSTTLADSKHLWASPFEINGEFGNLGLPIESNRNYSELRLKTGNPDAKSNTTIAVIATNVELDKSKCKQLAIMAHDGIARAIWPAHTPFDGDLIFSLSTGTKSLDLGINQFAEIGAAATSTLARAIARAIYSANSEENDLLPTWSNLNK